MIDQWKLYIGYSTGMPKVVILNPQSFKKKWHPQGKKIPPWRIPPHKDAKKPIWNQRLLYVSLTREHHEAMFDTIAASALSLSLRQALRWLVKSSWPSMCEEQCWLLSASNSRLKFSQFLLENEVTLKFKSPPTPQPLAGDHLAHRKCILVLISWQDKSLGGFDMLNSVLTNASSCITWSR